MVIRRLLPALAVLVWPAFSAAQTQVKPRFLIAFDTSGSMTSDLNGIPTYGDGVVGATQGLDTDCDGEVDDSRIYVAKEALRNMVLAFGDIEYALARFPQYSQTQVLCNDFPVGPGPVYSESLQIQNQECDTTFGASLGSMGNPTLNTNGALITDANCGAEDWDPSTAGVQNPIELIPSACRPSDARLYASGDPIVCINYFGNCPGATTGTIYTHPNGDILVGFPNTGTWPTTIDNRVGILGWINNQETAFDPDTTTGNFCDHAASGDCELRPAGPTPLAGLLQASLDYIEPIRSSPAIDPVGACRPYRVILLTDGAETCGGDPTTVAADLFTNSNVQVHVVGVAIAPGSRTVLNQIAMAGGTDAGDPGGDYAFFADDPITLANGLADIVADSLLVEECNDLDDDCDGAIDEGIVKYCNVPLGITDAELCDLPPETVCDLMDDNCNGIVDEGVTNACGECGPEPDEICGDGMDNDCDGPIDEGCGGCVPASEVCNDADDDCDGDIDEMLTRPCGFTLGECTAGTETCVAGDWTACNDVGPTTEVCDGLDNDCDGIADNLTRPCGSSTGECSPGVEHCQPHLSAPGAPVWGDCEGSIGPRDEVCDGLDNDCDTDIDEDVMGLGTSCGESLGECNPGATQCLLGMIECIGATGPMDEICDGLDNDCDGTIDDGLDVGAPCGSGVGECIPGALVCIDGEPDCVGAVGPTDEVCDLLDNDCDTIVDEDVGEGEVCGTTEGLCQPGTLMCNGGTEICDGEVPPSPEACDCNDNDCDGHVDEAGSAGSLCPEGATCVECQCALPCTITEVGSGCPVGRAPVTIDGQCICVAEQCNTITCAGETVEREGEALCAPNREDVAACVCRENNCTFGCDGVVCPAGTVCNPRDPSGRCVDDSCRGLGCLDGEICNATSGECEPDPCNSVDCPDDQACRAGVCEDTCGDVACGAGQSCHSGVCENDLCAGVNCLLSQTCDPTSGECITSECLGVHCPRGTVCNPLSGACVSDPCLTLHCPSDEVCVEGECVTPPTLDAGTEPEFRRVLVTGGGGCGTCTVGAESTSTMGDLWIVFLVGGVLLIRRRRSSTGATTLGAALIVMISGTGCDVDPFCIDCPSRTAVLDASVRSADASPAFWDGSSATDGGIADASRPDGCSPEATELCNEFDDDCDGFVDEGVNTSSDVNNCGGCGVVCTPPHAFPVCTDGVCSIDGCDIGWLDADGELGTGCEYRCLPTHDGDDSVCDLRDNDCDTAIDEEVDHTTDPDNCGSCGHLCRFAHATPTCVAGSCVRGDCDENYYDHDTVAENGCEYYCVQADPPNELCNGRDDDCDGSTDEGNPQGGGACGNTMGLCTAGTDMCIDGAIRCVGGVRPVLETCDGMDNDCDGPTDETTNFADDPNNCGSCGTVCAQPNAITRCNGGTCQFVACEPGWFDTEPAAGCEIMCDFRGAEACNGIDDDCDDDIDEGLTPPVGFCNPNGICAGTTATCDSGGTNTWVCNYTSSEYQDLETQCDAVDNDCDGLVDEPFALLGSACGDGIGACRRTGIYECNPADPSAVRCSAATAGTPGIESCNGTDDDCDGQIDEGISFENGLGPADPNAIPTVEMSVGGATVNVMRWEASRPDATTAMTGIVSTAACSRSNVQPWTVVTWMEARDACCALNENGACPATATSDGWRLCDVEDWEAACLGESMSCTWSYETDCSVSSSVTCNGAEYDSGSAGGDQDALFTTGSPTFSSCSTDWSGRGVYDLSGNAKEWTNTEVATGIYAIRGGSYNSLEGGRTCTFDFTVGDQEFSFPNTGFRCCHYQF